jgi:peroxiredoxin
MGMKPRSVTKAKIGWVACSILLGLGIFQCGQSPSEYGRTSQEAPLAPSFVLPDGMGREVKFSEFQGHVVLLNFWATWCEPCRMEVPHLNELYAKYAKEGLVVIGISLDYGKPEVVREFLQKKKIAFVVLMGNQEVVGAYGRLPGLGSMQGIPTTYLIDRRGRVVQKFVGFTSKKRLEESFQPLLNRKMT